MTEAKTTNPIGKNEYFSGGLMAHILTQQSSSKSIANASLVKENTSTSSQSPQVSTATVKPVIFRRAVPSAYPLSNQSAASAPSSTSTPAVMQNKSGASGTTSYAVIATGSAAGSNPGQSTPQPQQMSVYQLHAASNDHAQQQGSSQQPQTPYQHASAAFEYANSHGLPLYAQPTPYYPHHQSGGGGGGSQNQQNSGAPGQVLYSSGAYILQTTTSVDGDSHTLAHTTRASPATVQWLVDNYETADGVSLPRSTIYAHYMRHCEEEKLEPMNPASFGKLIRSVFVGLRTRRLGTRGNSKYHYYGIRIKATSPLINISEDMIMATAGRQYSSPPQQKRFGGGGGARSGMPGGRYDGSGPQQGTTTITVIGTPAPIAPSVTHQPGSAPTPSAAAMDSGATASAPGSNVSPQQQYLGDVTLALPRFEQLDLNGQMLSHEISEHDVRVFEQLYREHCESLVDLVVNLQFPIIEQIWASFWRGGVDTSGSRNARRNGEYDDDELVDEEIGEDEEGDEDGQPRRMTKVEANENEGRLPRIKLIHLASLPVIQHYMRRVDSALYQSLVYTLLPDMLRPIPSSLTQSIRNFAKGMESWLKNAMIGMPEDAVRSKLGPAVAFAQTLRRYTSLNHLAQAARAVLQNQEHLQQMVADLNRVDFVNVQEQAAWVTSCETKVVKQIETDLKRLLSIENSLDNWAAWLESVVDSALNQAIQHQQPLPAERQAQALAEASRQFLLKWSFYNSMVIRDLTLRSAHSFGSFHLIRLLFDEYIYFVLEHRVAHAVREVPIAVLDASRGSIDVPLSEPLYSLDICQARPDLRGPRLYPVVSATLQAAATAQQLAQTASGAGSFHLAAPNHQPQKSSNLIITPAAPSGGTSAFSANSISRVAPAAVSSNNKPSIITLTAASSPSSGGIKVSAGPSIPTRTPASAPSVGGPKIYVVPVNNTSSGSGNTTATTTNNNNNISGGHDSVDSGNSQPPIKRLKDDNSSPAAAAAPAVVATAQLG